MTVLIIMIMIITKMAVIDRSDNDDTASNDNGVIFMITMITQTMTVIMISVMLMMIRMRVVT